MQGHIRMHPDCWMRTPSAVPCVARSEKPRPLTAQHRTDAAVRSSSRIATLEPRGPRSEHLCSCLLRFNRGRLAHPRNWDGSLVQAIEGITGRRMCVPATALPGHHGVLSFPGEPDGLQVRGSVLDDHADDAPD
jgi:hypothetical protein